MKKLLKAYSDSNPERFNDNFIMSRDENTLIDDIQGIFKSFEALEEIEVISVEMETDESAFGPIKQEGQFYKSMLPTRLNKVNYTVKLTPNVDPTKSEQEKPFIIQKDFYINKLIDKCFYINEGVRYFMIYQIADIDTYGNKNSVSLRTLSTAVNIKRTEKDFVSSSNEVFTLPVFETALFNKKTNPLFYKLTDISNEHFKKFRSEHPDDFAHLKDEFIVDTILDEFNDFYDTSFKMADDPNEILEDGWSVFTITPKGKGKKKGNYISFAVPTDRIRDKSDPNHMILGSLLSLEMDKKLLTYNVKDFNTPAYWLDQMGSLMVRSPDFSRRCDRIAGIMISFNKIMDDKTKEILKFPEKDKECTMNIVRYLMLNFYDLANKDSNDLENKRLRLFEYQLYELRTHFMKRLHRVNVTPIKTKAILERIFTGLNPMDIVRNTIINELLRYYNSSNDFNLFTALLKATFRGPQCISSKNVSPKQRDLHPSYCGRLSLIASSPSDPGLTTTLVPFVDIHNLYFKKQD